MLEQSLRRQEQIEKFSDVRKKLFQSRRMSPGFPGRLTFAKGDAKDEQSSSIYKYLADASFDPDDVANWGRLGSLVEALNEAEENPCIDPILGDRFLEFVAQLPPGSAQRPQIRNGVLGTPSDV
jgi:hypothetical protein